VLASSHTRASSKSWLIVDPKHIDTRFHFIRELVNNRDISLQLCGSRRDQLADVFTKPLRKIVFELQK
jgi:hypothetical protein